MVQLQGYITLAQYFRVRVKYESRLWVNAGLLICINGSYSVETAAQRKDLPCNAIAQTNIVCLDSFFISKFYFLYNLTRSSTKHTRSN